MFLGFDKKYFNMKVFFTSLLAFLIVNNELFAKNNKMILLPIAADFVNIRERPSREGKVIGQLSHGTYVEILEKNSETQNIDGLIGKWVLVEGEVRNPDFELNSNEWSKRFTYIRIKGWVFDAYIAYPEKFKKVTNFNNYKLVGCIGDWCKNYEFYQDGTYISKTRDEKYMEVVSKGDVYLFRNIIRVVPKNRSIDEIYFYINDKKQICTCEGQPIFNLCSD